MSRAKTEPPTARRLRRARAAGDLPVSAPLIQGAGLLAAIVVAPAAIDAIATRCAQRMTATLRQSEPLVSPQVLLVDTVVMTAPLIAAIVLASVAAGLVQTGGIISASNAVPDLRRINPIAGLTALLSGRSLAGVARALVAALTTAGVAAWLLGNNAAELAACTGSLAYTAELAAAIASRLGWAAACLGLALATADAVRLWCAWRERLRMTRAELRQELREAEGDPEAKAARRRAHAEILQGVAWSTVADTAVVVTDDRAQHATALAYSADQGEAPRIALQARGRLAAQAVDAARQQGVPVVPRPAVASAIASLPVGTLIPPAQYEAVAQVLKDAWRE